VNDGLRIFNSDAPAISLAETQPTAQNMEHDMSVKKAIPLQNAMARIPDEATVMIGGWGDLKKG
jgi:hypothetical protein